MTATALSSFQSGLTDLQKLLTSLPADAPQSVKDAANAVNAAVTAVETAAPDLSIYVADQLINSLLAKIPGIGSFLEPEVDALANALIGALYAKLNLAPKTVAATTPTATVQGATINDLRTGDF